jgi:hypothetical protein
LAASLTEEYSTTFRRFAELFGVRRERANIPRLAEAACKEGFAIIAVEPEGKKPICTLTPKQRKDADTEARETAKAAGRRNWESAKHECGRNHAITDPAEARRVFTRLAKQGSVNIGAHPGKSRWIAVDADQADDVVAWMNHWAIENDDPSIKDAAPTVSSPGVFRGEEWKHKGGGHVWYWLPPEIDFSECDINAPMPYMGAQVYFADALILLPPSTRPEGEYVVQSDACQAPAWLVDALLNHIAEHTEKAENYAQRVHDGNSPIDRWALDQSWDELLSGDGWTFTHKSDNCSCPIWRRPGDDAGSSKSATAHEAGCLRFGDDDDFPGFLHLWSDNPPGFLQDYVRATGKKSISKFNYVAWRDHAGDTGTAFRELGLTHDSTDFYLKDPLTDQRLSCKERESVVTQNRSSEPCKTTTDSRPKSVESDTESKEQDTESSDVASLPAVESQPLSEGDQFIRERLAMEAIGLRDAIARELGRLEANDRAKVIRRERDAFLAEKGGVEELGDMGVNMKMAFSQEWEDEEWVITGLLPLAGKALFTAPAKAGKTTTMGTMIRALTREEPLFGQFPVFGAKRVTVIDTEMTPRKSVSWLKSADVDPDLVTAFYMRGRAQMVDLRSEAAQIRWARVLRENKTEILVIDPLSPILAGLGLDENAAGDVQSWLAGVDALITRAELHGAVVVHHHGHSGERGRGSSAFLGWPDAIWTLVKDDNDTRYFGALGRDIEVPESALEFDPETKILTVPEIGARRQSKGDVQKSVTDTEVLNVIRGNPGSTARTIAELMEKSLATIQRATERLELAGKITFTEGPRNAKLWRIA